MELNMDAVEITSLKDRLIINIDKSMFSKEYLVNLLNRLRLEELAKKADFNENVLKISDEIKSNWWKENKDRFLNK